MRRLVFAAWRMDDARYPEADHSCTYFRIKLTFIMFECMCVCVQGGIRLIADDEAREKARLWGCVKSCRLLIGVLVRMNFN